MAVIGESRMELESTGSPPGSRTGHRVFLCRSSGAGHGPLWQRKMSQRKPASLLPLPPPSTGPLQRDGH